MKRSILAIAAGLLTWLAVASLLDLLLRSVISGYAAAEPRLTFTMTMMVGRLALGAASSLAAGACAGWIAQGRAWVPWALGALILAFFLPTHVRLWPIFPVWYHLTFLLTLVPLVVLGATVTRQVVEAYVARPT